MKQKHDLFRRFAEKACLLSGVVLMGWITGCSGSPAPSTASGTLSLSQRGPQTYFASTTAGTTNSSFLLHGPEVYVIDNFVDAFSQSTFQLDPPAQEGGQVLNSGATAGLPRGLVSLKTLANYIKSGSSYVATTPATASGFAVVLAGQAGGLVQLAGQPVTPLVAAVQCPSLKTAQTYQFLTIPAPLNLLNGPTWDPAKETAYGSVEISSTGSMVTFDKIRQFTLPSAGGTGVPAQPASSPVAGVCAPTFFGNTISLPSPAILTDPVVSGGTLPPSATVGIGPTGLLVEDNRSSTGEYSALGAGTGAVGLPEPSSPIDTSAAISAQYLGFFYGAGANTKTAAVIPWSSHISSFGFPTIPTSCASVVASTSTLIYGGDFNNDDPTTSPDGYGYNCDLAIDLGKQDPSNNGRYPAATVWMGASYVANTRGQSYSFPAVAIAGQLNGKYAIFLIGLDSTQPWGIYLLQSN